MSINVSVTAASPIIVETRPGETIQVSAMVAAVPPDQVAYLNHLRQEVRADRDDVEQRQDDVISRQNDIISRQDAVTVFHTDVTVKHRNVVSLHEETTTLTEENSALNADTRELRGQAATSASNAAGSESAAAASERNAATSESAAASSEQNAATSEQNAYASASSALNSKNAAAASESNSAESEAAAVVSEENAATSEQNAATSAAKALVSERAAKSSEFNAAGSESAAAASERNAAASESAADNSERNAATSEQNASSSESASLNSKNTAKVSETNAKASELAAKASEDEAEHWALVAERHASSVVNALVFRGPWDATNGAPPTPSPETPDFYKINVAGIINGEQYEVGDNIVWDTVADEWFRIDNNDRPISDSLQLDSSVVSASAKSVKTLDGKKLDKTANAVSASQWETARTVTVSGGAQGSFSIDGSANVSLSITIKDDSHRHSITYINGLQAALDNKLGVGSNAASATKLLTPRTISVTGDATGSAEFDGTADVSIEVEIKDGSHGHTIANVSGLQTALNGKEPTLAADRKRKITASTEVASGTPEEGEIWVQHK